MPKGALAALKTAREAQAASAERSPLEQHEAGIRYAFDRGRRAFLDIGQYLKAIRDGRLYKATHSNFDDYCRERWNIGRSYADRLIKGHDVVAGLLSSGKVTPIGATSEGPTTEAQAREVAQAKPEERAEVMQAAADRAGGEPTAKAIREVIEDRKPDQRRTNDAALVFSGRLSRLADVAMLDPVVMAANISQQTADSCETIGRWLITVADAHRERSA